MENVKQKNNDAKRTNYEPMAVSKNIRPLLNKVLGKSGIMQLEILSHWNEIVGEDLGQYCFPEKIEFRGSQRSNGTLCLVVPSGAFALELQHREQQILGRVNVYFGYGAVGKLRIRQDSQFNLNDLKEKKTLSKEEPLLVSEEEKNYILEMGQDIQDEKLKEILIKLGYLVFNDVNKKDKRSI